MSKPTILTGLRANNDLHIGNYFGALLPLVDMAKNRSTDYNINLFMPDLHSIVTPVDHDELRRQIIRTLKLYAAAGLPLDTASVRLYRQSRVSAHSELTWILGCFTGMGQMSRMTQYKDKSAKLGDEQINVGLFTYPILMAADILLYDTQFVPVGDDQSQHIEFTRDIGERFNSRFGDLFKLPEPVAKQHEFFGKDQGLRIMDLQDLSKKMSKSTDNDRGAIFLGDDPADAKKKIMSAATDSIGAVHYNPKEQPGISNLLQILALLSGQTVAETAVSYDGMTSYGEFKSVVAEKIAEFLTDFQTKFAEVDEAKLMQKLEADEVEIAKIANQKLMIVQQALGLR